MTADCLIIPREEQRNVVTQAFNTLRNERSVLIVAPTGYGKTVVMADMARQEVNRDGRVLQVVNLQVLLGQTVATNIHGFGVNSSALHDKINTYLYRGIERRLVCNYNHNIVVTMPRTFNNTIKDGVNDLYFDPNFVPTLIQFDEAHKATSAEFQAIKNHWPDAKIVGFTATPYRAKNEAGESLEEWYGDNIIIASTIQEQIELGNLARPVYIEKSEDDYVANEWLDLTNGQDNKRTIIFTDDTDHSKALEAQFAAKGIKVEVVTAGKGNEGDDDWVPKQSPATRNAIFSRFHSGETEVLISVNALCEGFDEKQAKYCFLTRRVANIAFYQQMCGRVLRACPGKPEGFIVDFANNIKEHGPIEAIEWPRASKGLVVNAADRIRAKSFRKKTNVNVNCPGCGHCYNIKRRNTCYHCGSSHGVMLTGTVAETVEERFGLSQKEFEDFAAKFTMAQGSQLVQDLINRKFEIEIFVNGQLNQEFKFLPSLIDSYRAKKIRKGNVYIGDWNAEFMEPA